jgi:hypothetical protein
MCNHQTPVSLRIPENMSTWSGKDLPIEDVGTGAPIFHVTGKATSWSGRKRMHHAFRCLCGVASRLARSQNSRTRKARRFSSSSKSLCTSTRRSSRTRRASKAHRCSLRVVSSP